MVSFKHITVEEAIALADGRYVLLPVTEEHIKNCPECAAMIKSFSDCKEIFAEAREFIPAVEEAKVAEIAAKSFANLPFEEENEPEKEKGFSLSALFASWFKPALAFSLALAVMVTLFNREKLSENTENEVEVATTAGAEAVPETKEDYVSGERESGAEVKLAKATISVISKTYLDKVSDTDVTMKSGKAKFDVVTGNDFRIDVDGKFLVRVLGTSFTLDYSDGRLTAEVFSGLVEIIEKSNGSATQLSKDMNRTFEYASNKDRLNAITTTGKKTKNNLKKHDFALTPGKSFLFQGREALAAGKTGAAQQLFTMEIEKGKEPDKALFELVSIHESKKDWGEIANLVKKYGGVMRESRVYKEELMIKGCISQKRSGNKALPLCHDYLREFPRSFRSREIKGIIDEK